MPTLPALRRLIPALALALAATPALSAELTLTPYNPGNDAIFQVASVLVSGGSTRSSASPRPNSSWRWCAPAASA